MVYRAKCCNPVRGEEIIGYITRGKGIAVHAKHCSNVQNLLYDADRRIDVEWVGPKYALYAVKLALRDGGPPGHAGGRYRRHCRRALQYSEY